MLHVSEADASRYLIKITRSRPARRVKQKPSRACKDRRDRGDGRTISCHRGPWETVSTCGEQVGPKPDCSDNRSLRVRRLVEFLIFRRDIAKDLSS